MDTMTFEEAEDEIGSMYEFPWRAEMSDEPPDEGTGMAWWHVVDAVGQIVAPALSEAEAVFLAECVNRARSLIAQ